MAPATAGASEAGPVTATALSGALEALLRTAAEISPSELVSVIELAGSAIGATSARMLVADYGLLSLQEVGTDGPLGVRDLIEGTLAGRCFATGQMVVVEGSPTRVWVPLTDGSERFGVLELLHPAWTEDVRTVVDPIVRLLVLVLISKRRYTDVLLRGRRSRPLSTAAEIQWSLLPPLTCSTTEVSVSGILEPAYSIGGDSFDYALNPGRVEFVLLDAVGHGLAAVSIAVLVLNALRNARREGHDLERAYHNADEVLRSQIGRNAFATAQVGCLDIDSGTLTWLNAGHPPPLLVRDRGFVRELASRPSLPIGLNGTVREIASEQLQPGDRLLFYTDGVIESRSPEQEVFGVERLADLLVRVSTDERSPVETVRRLAATVLAHNGGPLRDDATLLLLEYHGRAAPSAVSACGSANDPGKPEKP